MHVGDGRGLSGWWVTWASGCGCAQVLCDTRSIGIRFADLAVGPLGCASLLVIVASAQPPPLSSVPPPPVLQASPSGCSQVLRRWFRRVGMVVVAVLGAAAGAALMASAAFSSFALVAFFTPVQWFCQYLPGHSADDCNMVAMKPGRTFTVIDNVEIDGAGRFDPSGNVLLTTVAMDMNGISLLEWLEWSTDGTVELHPRVDMVGDLSDDEVDERHDLLMQTSQETSVIAALDYLGVEAAESTGVGFAKVLPDSSADGRLEPGEVIVALDGRPVTTVPSLVDLLATRPPGATVVLAVQGTDSQERSESIVLGVHPDGDKGLIGISGLHEQIEWRSLPFEIDISAGSVGGPSGGLAFSLSLIDLLTPGELTGGLDVAVTGTISSEGNVGNVGGVRQKAVAARRSKADLFIVPDDLLHEAHLGAGSMPVVGVASLEEAIHALSLHGGQTADLSWPPSPPPAPV